MGTVSRPMLAERREVTRLMYEKPYELGSAMDGYRLRIRARGLQVLSNPLLNRGTAFTPEERRALGLTGLLPSGVSTIEGQLRRVYAQYRRQPTELAKNVYLANLRDRNEVLFYRLLSEHISEMLPIVYTPTVGQAIERFSHEYRRRPGPHVQRRHAGTSAVVLAAAFAAVRAAGARLRDQQVVIHGGGTAGAGIADMLHDVMVREGLSQQEATPPVLPAGHQRADHRRPPVDV
jgi:hypothetical protein